MESNRGTTALVLVANSAYAVGLAAALQSVVQHTRPCPSVYVVDCGLDEGDRAMAEQIVPIHWVHFTPAREQALRRAGLLPAAGSRAGGYAEAGTWAKLGLGQLLPEGVQRALYLDCDMLALTSLQPLLGWDLQGNLLAAVRDVGHPCGPPALAGAGWPAGRPYFNAGLLLVDLQKLRAAAGAIGATLAQHGAHLTYHDQDVLNLVAASSGGWLELPLRWNAQGVGTYARFRLRAEPGRPALFGSQAELQRYLNGWVPYTSKPWAYLCQHPFIPTFFAALDATSWAGWRPQQGQVAQACAAEAEELLARVAAEKPEFNAAACRQELVSLLINSKASAGTKK